MTKLVAPMASFQPKLSDAAGALVVEPPGIPLFLLAILVICLLLRRSRASKSDGNTSNPRFGTQRQPDSETDRSRHFPCRRRCLGLGRVVQVGDMPVNYSFWTGLVTSIGPHEVCRTTWQREITAVGNTSVKERLLSIEVNGIPQRQIVRGSWEAAVLEVVRDDRDIRIAPND